MEGLDKTDDNLLTKINGLQTDNAQSLADFGKDLDNKLAQHDKNYQVEHDSIRSETHILNQHLEEVKSLHVATEKRIVEMDAGNQQLLEKLLGVEKDLDGKLQGVNDNANSLVTKLNSLDNDTKNNSQTIVNLQESIYIQTEQVKKVDAERQQAEVKNKEDMENTVSTNAKAIADLKAELGDAITKIEITLKEEQTKDNSSLIDRLTIVQDATTSNQGRIESLEKAGPESIQNLVLEIDNKLKGYDESASQKLREAEDNIQKIAQGIASHSNLLREHTENINTFISTNATFTNQFHALETKSEDFLKYLQVERQRIDNVESGLNGLDETVQKALPDIKRNTDRIDELDARQTNLGKNLDDTSNQVQDNVKEIASLKQVLGNQNSNLGDVEERLKQNEDQIKHIDDTIDGLHKTVAIFEGRHVETVEKMKEVTVLASNIQVQVSEQAQKMVEQSSNDLNQIRDQIQDFENQNGLSNQKISELDSGNQALLEKLLGLEKSIVDRMEGLDKTDDNLLTKINGLQTDNAQSLADFGKDLDNKLAQHDKNYQVEHDSIRSETHILNQHLEEVKSLHVATEKRIVEMDAGNQQLLEKLLGVEKDLDGKLQGVNDNANSLVTKLNSLDNDTKNNSQTIVNLQESIYIQTEQVKKVDAERQQAEAKNKEDMENTVSTNAKAIADLKAELGDAITKIEITLKEEQTKDNSSLIDRLTIVQDATTSNQGRIESLEKAGPESIQNLVLEIDNKLKGYDESASQKLREAEDNIQKNAQGIVSLQSTSTIESEKMHKLESLMSSSTSDIKSLFEKTNRFSQYLQAIEVLEDKINNLDEVQERNENRIRIEINENITKNTQDLRLYIETKLEHFKSDLKTESVSIRKDADALLKQMEAFKAQHRDIENKFVDINTDQQQISNELNTIQQNYDSQLQYINESAFIQNEDSFITKLNIIEEESRNNLEKIIAMEEVAMIQAEKAKYVESLTSRVNQIDEMRQKSEAKAKEDFDNTVSKNAKEIQDLKLSLEQTMIQIEHYMKEENTAIKSENSSISKQVQVLKDDAVKQNQQLIEFLREKAELESKLEENIRESESLRKKGDSLRDTLANYEEIVDKKINQIQEESKISSKLLSDITPKLNFLDRTVVSIEENNREQIMDMKVELSNETKNLLELLRKEVDGALVTNMEKIIEFEKDVQNLRKDNELSFSDHDTKIMTLLTANEEHSSFFEKVTTNISSIETRMTSYDQRQKAITENLLITSEAQLNEIRNKFDNRIAELVKRTDEHSDLFEQTEVKIVHMYDQSNKIEEDLFHTQRDVEDLKKQGGNEKELVVMKIKEQKETLEAFFRSLEQKVETIETTQIKESSRVEIIEKQTESQERLAMQLEEKIKQ